MPDALPVHPELRKRVVVIFRSNTYDIYEFRSGDSVHPTADPHGLRLSTFIRLFWMYFLLRETAKKEKKKPPDYKFTSGDARK